MQACCKNVLNGNMHDTLNKAGFFYTGTVLIKVFYTPDLSCTYLRCITVISICGIATVYSL